MFEIVSVFTRPDTEVDFFYRVHAGHSVVQEILKAYNQLTGSTGTSLKYFDGYRMEVSMTFENKNQFWKFVEENKDLLDQRAKLIEDWCDRTSHTYSFYTNDV